MISLKKTKDIERVFKLGRGFKEDTFLIKAVKNKLKQTRFAFVTGLKVSKKANQRNTVKRRIREVIRACLSQISPGFDVVIVALAGAANKDFQEIESAVKKLLIRSGLIP